MKKNMLNFNFDESKPLENEVNQVIQKLSQRKQRPEIKTMESHAEKQKQPVKVCKAPITPKHVKEQKLPKNGNTLNFPIEIMSGLAGDFARIYGNHLEAPDHFFYMSYLTIFGLYVSDRLWLDSQRKPAPRFYTILLGESSDTRKSTAIEETVQHFTSFIQPEAMAVCRGAASGEGLGRLLKQTVKVLLYYDELKTFVSKCNIKQSTLLTATNILFESTKYENWTTRDPFVIKHGLLAMLAASTTDTYANLFDSKFLDIGFNNRLFIVPGDSHKCFPVPKPIPVDQINYLHEKLQERLDLLQDGLAMPIEKDAEKLWTEFYTQIKGQGPHSKRLDVYGSRFMPLLALNDMKTAVDLETVEKVILLLKWQHHVRQVHDPIDADNKIARMEEAIRRAFKIKNKWHQRDLQRKVNYRRCGLWVWESAIKNLTKNIEIHFDAKHGIYRLATFKEQDPSYDSRFDFLTPHPKGLSNTDIEKLNE